MKTLPIRAAKAAKKQYLSAYGKCLKYIIDILKKSGLNKVELQYDSMTPRCYNLNNTTGEEDCNVIVRIELDRNGDSLILYDESGNEYPTGSDEFGQDNYTIANIDVLVDKVAYFAELVTCSQMIEVAKGQTRLRAIMEHIGKDRQIAFEHNFPKPKLNTGEEILMVTAREVNVKTERNESQWYWLRSLKQKDLDIIIKGINDYVLYIHNNV